MDSSVGCVAATRAHCLLSSLCNLPPQPEPKERCCRASKTTPSVVEDVACHAVDLLARACDYSAVGRGRAVRVLHLRA
jgi:hypothetical protein